MKLNRLETHDRLQYFVKDQSVNIFQGAEDCLKRNPLSLALQEKSPYIYIFSHPRTDENGITKRMLWQPRLSIPTPQTNSYLFRALSNKDIIEVIWLIPPREMWPQYKKGNVTESDEVIWSIYQFQQNKKELEKPHPEDMPEEKVKLILKAVIDEKLYEVRSKKAVAKIVEYDSNELPNPEE